MTAREVTLVAVPSRRRRGLASGLISFGVAGLVLVVCGAALVLGSIGALGDTAATIEAQRRSLIALLGPAADAMDHAASSARDAGTSLTSSATAARDAADLTDQLASAMTRMSDAARVEILGTQPFGSTAEEFRAVADRSSALSKDLLRTSTTLDTNVAGASTAADDLARLAVRLRALRDGLGPTSSDDPVAPARTAVDATRIVLLGLLAWLAVPAVAAIWLGWRWLRATPRG